MVLAFCLNENFVQHLLVCLNSIFETNGNEEIEIFVLHHTIQGPSIKLIEDHVLASGKRISFIKVDFGVFMSFPVSNHISAEAYFRIALPNVLPLRIKKVLYLDIDILVIASLRELWNTNLEGSSLGAVPERSNYRNIEMGLGNTKNFNSGVLLLDLEKWRRENSTEKVFHFIRQNTALLKFHDQDALNQVFLNDWKELPLKWNVTFPYFRTMGGEENAPFSSIEDKAIIHFTQTYKPWHYILRHPYKDLYYKYLEKTPFKNYRPADKTLINILRRRFGDFLIGLNFKKL